MTGHLIDFSLELRMVMATGVMCLSSWLGGTIFTKTGGVLTLMKTELYFHTRFYQSHRVY